jgi:hypothetical protein
MARRVGEVATLDRRSCRESVGRRFSTRRFIERHVALYRRVLANSPARFGWREDDIASPVVDAYVL